MNEIKHTSYKMRNFRKTCLLLAVIFAVTIVHAQTYRLEAGFVSPKQHGDGFSTTYFNGIRLGATAEFNLKHNFSLLTGALYSVVYSNKVQNYSTSDSVIYKTFGHFLDIPLRLTYTLPIAKNLKVFAFAGPNLNIGLAQQQKIQADLSNTWSAYTGIKSVNYGDNDLYKDNNFYKNALISRINFQMGAGGGVQWKNYQLKGGYDFGINSINKIDTNKILYQSGWYVSLVYQF